MAKKLTTTAIICIRRKSGLTIAGALRNLMTIYSIDGDTSNIIDNSRWHRHHWKRKARK